jgi:opacity protein-like surface antigen
MLIRPAALAAALLASPALAQEPAAGPPPSGTTVEPGGAARELLPDIGKIGAEVGLAFGASWNPYETGSGVVGGGFVDLPLRRAPGGKLSYEILLTLSDATSPPFTITDPIAIVANLAFGASLPAAIAGPPAAPFPVRREVSTRLRVLQVSPFGLKYAITRFDDARLRPYVAAGLDLAVVISRQDPERDESLVFAGQPPFDDPLIAGLVAQAPELTARGLPTGQGNTAFGFHVGGGIEVRLSKGLSLNADYRGSAIDGTDHWLHALTAGLGFHW